MIATGALQETRVLECVGADKSCASDAIAALAADMRILAFAIQTHDGSFGVDPTDYGHTLARLAARAELLGEISWEEDRAPEDAARASSTDAGSAATRDRAPTYDSPRFRRLNKALSEELRTSASHLADLHDFRRGARRKLASALVALADLGTAAESPRRFTSSYRRLEKSVIDARDGLEAMRDELDIFALRLAQHERTAPVVPSASASEKRITAAARAAKEG